MSKVITTNRHELHMEVMPPLIRIKEMMRRITGEGEPGIVEVESTDLETIFNEINSIDFYLGQLLGHYK